jgi:hypothetical protein
LWTVTGIRNDGAGQALARAIRQGACTTVSILAFTSSFFLYTLVKMLFSGDNNKK